MSWTVKGLLEGQSADISWTSTSNSAACEKLFPAEYFFRPCASDVFWRGRELKKRQQIDTQVGRIQVCYMLICVCVYVYMYIWCLVSIYTSEKSHKTWSFQLFSKRQSSLKPSFWRFPCQIFPRCIHTYRRYIYIYRPKTSHFGSMVSSQRPALEKSGWLNTPKVLWSLKKNWKTSGKREG